MNFNDEYNIIQEKQESNISISSIFRTNNDFYFTCCAVMS